MDGSERVCAITEAEALHICLLRTALAEHAAVSRSPVARGLSQVNTDMMTVGTR